MRGVCSFSFDSISLASLVIQFTSRIIMGYISKYSKHFDRYNGYAVCKYCNEQIKTGGGSTSGLKRHYERMHESSKEKDSVKRKHEETESEPSTSKIDSKKPKLIQRTIVTLDKLIQWKKK